MGGSGYIVITRLGILLTLVVLMAACVQPIPPAPTPSPTVFIPPTQPVPDVQGPTFPPAIIIAWLSQNMGVSATNVTLFTQVPIGPDDILGYTFTDAQAQFCVGFAQTTEATSQVWNADYRCALAGTQVIVKPAVFALTNGEFYVATFGYVDPALGANAYAIEFPVGSPLTGTLTNNGFVALHQGIDFPLQLTIINPEGNAVLPPIPIQ